MRKYHAVVLAVVAMACAVDDENVGSSNFDSVTEGTSVSVDNPYGASTTVSDFNLSGAFSTVGSPATPFWFVGYEDLT